MPDWEITITAERLTLTRRWPKDWRAAWGVGRLSVVGSLILLIMLRYVSEQGLQHVSAFDWLCLTGGGGLTGLGLASLLRQLRQGRAVLVCDRTGGHVSQNGREVTSWEAIEGLVLRQVGISPVAYSLLLVYQGTRQLPIIHYSADEPAVRHLADTLSRYLGRPLTQA